MMKNNYWTDNSPITASIEEKLQPLRYEILMFKETCKRFKERRTSFPLNGFEHNLIIESFATHVRTLIEFFYCDDKKNKNDLIAQDFLPYHIIWKDVRPSKSIVLVAANNKADKQIAHLSLWRIKLDRDGKKDWKEWEIINADINNTINKFNEVAQTSKGNPKDGLWVSGDVL